MFDSQNGVRYENTLQGADAKLASTECSQQSCEVGEVENDRPRITQ